MLFASKKFQQASFILLIVVSCAILVMSCSEKQDTPVTPALDSEKMVNVASTWSRPATSPSGTSSTPGSAPAVPEGTPTPLPGNVHVSESLQNGVTAGTYDDATLTAEGLQLHGGTGYIQYIVPTTPAGYVEFNAKGFEQDELHGGSEFKSVIMTMWGGGDYLYETMPYAYEFRKFGYIEGRPDASNALEVRMITEHDWSHGSRYIHGWDPSVPYRFRVEWGNGLTRVYRDGVEVASASYHGEFAPAQHVIQIGANRASSLPHRHKESPHNLLITDVEIGAL